MSLKGLGRGAYSRLATHMDINKVNNSKDQVPEIREIADVWQFRV